MLALVLVLPRFTHTFSCACVCACIVCVNQPLLIIEQIEGCFTNNWWGFLSGRFWEMCRPNPQIYWPWVVIELLLEKFWDCFWYFQIEMVLYTTTYYTSEIYTYEATEAVAKKAPKKFWGFNGWLIFAVLVLWRLRWQAVVVWTEPAANHRWKGKTFTLLWQRAVLYFVTLEAGFHIVMDSHK